MSVFDRFRTWLWQPLLDRVMLFPLEKQQRVKEMAVWRSYADGRQAPQIKVKPFKPDDNIIVNLCGRVIAKSVALLFGSEISFDLGEGATDDQTEYIKEQWDVNNKQILLNDLGESGSESGTGYVKILVDWFDDGLHWLMLLDPLQMEIITDPQNVDIVRGYEQLWAYKAPDGKDVVRREVTEAIFEEDAPQSAKPLFWEVRIEEKKGRKWEEISSTQWDYDFPPIIHAKNLPNAFSPYGKSDIEQVIMLQNRFNFVASNISRIIRFHAHPKTVGTGFKTGDLEAVEAGADQMLTISNAEAKVFNLEMQSELISSMGFARFLEDEVNSITGTVDPSTIKDKLGQLTNLGIQMLYQTALEKLGLKRGNYGEMLTELNRRLLVIGGDDDAKGGKVVWPSDVLPESEKEEADTMTVDLGNGLVSKETASITRGYDWEQEQTRIEGEVTNIGESILDFFNRPEV